MTRQLHIVRSIGDSLALDVARRQVTLGDEVRLVLVGAAVDETVPPGSEAIRMATLEYDQLVQLMAWCERVVSW